MHESNTLSAGTLATSLLLASEGRGDAGKRGEKAAHSDRIPDSATSSHPPPAEPSCCHPQGGCCPPSLQDTLRGTGGTKGWTRLLPGVEVPGSKFDESSRRRRVRRGARHLKPHPCRRGSALTCVSAGKPVVLGRRLSRPPHSGITSAQSRSERKRDPELFLRPLPHAPLLPGGGEQLQLSQAPGNQPPRTLAPATSQPGLRRLHPSRGAGSEETGSAGSWAGDSLSLS